MSSIRTFCHFDQITHRDERTKDLTEVMDAKGQITESLRQVILGNKTTVKILYTKY